MAMKNTLLILTVAATLPLASCTTGPNAQSGTVLGALGGAAAGGIIGHQSGHGLEGAAIGGVLGGVGGNVIGGAQDQRNAEAYYYRERQAYRRPVYREDEYYYDRGY